MNEINNSNSMYCTDRDIKSKEWHALLSIITATYPELSSKQLECLDGIKILFINGYYGDDESIMIGAINRLKTFKNQLSNIQDQKSISYTR